MHRAFIRFGHGYETGSRGRCEAFDGFTIIAAPLGGFDKASRESRIFRRESGNGTDYSSHAIALAKPENCTRKGDLHILMQHGGGREVLRVPDFYDGGTLEDTILALPERVQYSLLYMIWKTASEARYEARSESALEWKQAIADKRIRKKRAGTGYRVEIIEQWEIEMKARAAAEKRDARDYDNAMTGQEG